MTGNRTSPSTLSRGVTRVRPEPIAILLKEYLFSIPHATTVAWGLPLYLGYAVARSVLMIREVAPLTRYQPQSNTPFRGPSATHGKRRRQARHAPDAAGMSASGTRDDSRLSPRTPPIPLQKQIQR